MVKTEIGFLVVSQKRMLFKTVEGAAQKFTINLLYRNTNLYLIPNLFFGNIFAHQLMSSRCICFLDHYVCCPSLTLNMLTENVIKDKILFLVFGTTGFTWFLKLEKAKTITQRVSMEGYFITSYFM